MIERKFVSEKLREFQIQECVASNLKGAGHSHTKVQRTPLGEKIVIYASRPGMVVGRKGQNIKDLTKLLKKKFNSENPQIEMGEVENINLDAGIVAERIADSLERFGANKFKSIGHKVMTDVMNAGALGIEIVISGKIPGARAKSWRFYSGYLKKCGDISIEGVRRAQAIAKLKVGIVGVKVRIMPPTIQLPDRIGLLDDKKEKIEEEKKTENPAESKVEEKANAKKKKEDPKSTATKEEEKDEAKGNKSNE